MTKTEPETIPVQIIIECSPMNERKKHKLEREIADVVFDRDDKASVLSVTDAPSAWAAVVPES